MVQRTTAVFLELFDGRFPWASHDERERLRASPDPADQEALQAIDQLTQAAWDWMEARAPVPWRSGDAAKELEDYLVARFPWCAGDAMTRLLNWASWISWHEGLAEPLIDEPHDGPPVQG